MRPFILQQNPLKLVIREGRTAFGLYVATPSPAVVELAGLAGLDFVRIDWVHSPLDPDMIEHMIRAAECRNIVPFIRVNPDQHKISSVLEMGAMGIVVPDVSTAETARVVVNAAKFSPFGDRGLFSASRKSGYGSIDGATFKKWTNEEVMICIQIESLEAIENLDQILDVPGIDMVLSGRGDLSNALGVPGQKDHPSVLEAEEKIFDMAQAKGIAISPQIDPASQTFKDELSKWNAKGAHVISLGVDVNIFKKALMDMMNNIQQASS